jgi:hypothetical protein
MNCGVNNFDTVQEVLWLVGEHEPDFVLRWTDPSRKHWLASVRAHSRFVDLACDWAYRRRGLSVYSERRTELFAEDEPGWKLVRESLRKARDLLAEREVPFAVALYPFLVREGDALTSHAAFEIVKSFCAAEGIRCIDAEPAFLPLDVDSMRISPHDYHGDAEAHGVFAAAVCEGLEGEGLLAAAIERAQ